MRAALAILGATSVVVTALGAPKIKRSSVPPPMLLPGSSDLVRAHTAPRCDSLWFLAQAPGDSAPRSILANRSEQREIQYQGHAAVSLVSTVGTPKGPVIDSAIIERDGLAPILETTRTSAGTTRYRYDRNRVEIATTPPGNADSPKQHQYMFPVFNFEELGVLIRSLPLRPGYEALLPLYSEGDDDAEVDTVRVEGIDALGAWRIQFADKVVVATYGITDATRQEVSYSHTFRRDGPYGKAGTVWRRAYHSCASHDAH